MGFIRKFTNVKVGTTVSNGAAGPQTFPANTIWFTQLIPCKGALMVWFRFTSTDTNVMQTFTFAQMFASAAGPGVSDSGDNLSANAPTRMNGGYVVMWSAGSGRFYYDFCSLNFKSHATLTHTAFQVDVEVVYFDESEAWRADTGQFQALPL